MHEPLMLVTAAFALLSVVLLVTALAAVRKQRWMGTGVALVVAVLFLAMAALAATLSLATQGYQALTREVVAATVVTRPTGPERFMATFAFPDGRREHYELTGNALYVDAHIVKWHPLDDVRVHIEGVPSELVVLAPAVGEGERGHESLRPGRSRYDRRRHHLARQGLVPLRRQAEGGGQRRHGQEEHGDDEEI